MMVDAISALSATKSAWEGSPSTAAAAGGATAAAAPAGDFGSVMTHVVSDAVGTLQAGESAAIQGIQGAAPAFKVVEAVMSAQRTLQETLAIRDKLVSAWQEITRMSI
jgi:flagellar hook-basal body complex protein FliE